MKALSRLTSLVMLAFVAIAMWFAATQYAGSLPVVLTTAEAGLSADG